MTYSNLKIKAPVAMPLISSEKQTKLIVHGQGVFLFSNSDNTKPCLFFIYNNDRTDGLKVEFTKENVVVTRLSNKTVYGVNKEGLTDLSGAYYWFSLDSQNQTFRAGKGEARQETMFYDFVNLFTENADRKQNKAFLESLTQIQIADESTTLNGIRLLRDPVTTKIPLIVKPTNDLTMNDVALGTYLPKANLSPAAQQLYDCISGKNFVLDTDDFPEFSQAIEYSIKTQNCWCNKRLQEKSTEFSKDKPNPTETYLRITLGQNNGESPGIPYVMEIWPPGHYSPVHNHSGADAIIRVLTGEINVSLFPFLSESGIKPFANANFSKDQITWISPTLNQTHQLKNQGTNTCVTIQCYMYDQDDDSHYDYFDYLDDNGVRQQYEPDSDMDFIQFKKLMKKEWSSRTLTQKKEQHVGCLPWC
jgi:predicted metal-dependent enzyme (double-stranded beta helix superfamily)